MASVQQQPVVKFLTRAAALAVVFVAFLALAQPADADLSFCPTGTGAGECSNPQGLATDFETGRLYVADQGNNRVNVFEVDEAEGEVDFLFAFGWGVDTGAATPEKCTTASACQAGIPGSGAGQLSAPARIAVDNAVGSASWHDVYVAEQANNRVQKFSDEGSFLLSFGSGSFASIRGVAVVSPGTVYVADTTEEGPCPIGPGTKFAKRVQKFSDVGAPVDTVTPTDAPCGQVAGFAADDAGNYYLANEPTGPAIRKYTASGTTAECTKDTELETGALAVDEAGHLFASQREVVKVGFQVFAEYDSACEPVRRFAYTPTGGESIFRSLAALHSPVGDVFGAANNKGVNYLKAPPPGPLIVPATLEASPVRSVWATLKAAINPEGKATTYKVDYVDEHSFETEGGFAGPNTRSSGNVSLGASDFSAHFAEVLAGCKPYSEAIFAEGKCLKPETDYRFRIVAENADGKGELEGQLTTNAPMALQATFASEVGTDVATLNAQLNPFGSPASGYFEYVDEATYQESGFADAAAIPDVPGGEAPLNFGTGEETVTRGATLAPLPPGTTYRYRLIATDPFTTLTGPERSFTTFKAPQPEAGCPNEAFRTGASALLPDCRAYEMVSPLDKEDADILALFQIFTNLPAVLNQSAVSGDRLAYGSYRSFGDAPSAPLTSQYVAERGKDGWQSHGINPPAGSSISGDIEFDFEFRAFSDDLCQGWIIPLSEPPLAEGASPGNRNLYRRTDRLCGAEGYEPLSPAKPEKLAEIFFLELQGVSDDGSVTAFAANDSLEGSGAPSQPASCTDTDLSSCKLRLYLKAPGQGPRYACILPGGAPAGECSAGTNQGAFGRARSANVTNALSADATRVFWTASAADGKIYLRENPLDEGFECTGEGSPCTTAVSKEAEEESGTSSSHFWAAAEDGTAAIFTTDEDLYEFDVETEATEKIAGEARGVLGASEDASHVYFASEEAIPGSGQNSEGNEAQAGQPNLYLHEAGAGGGSYRFVATLAAADVTPTPDQQTSSATAPEPELHNGRVSPDGTHAAFMSQSPITGYDNTDVSSPENCGEPKGICDTEVFLYDAEADAGVGELRCASCNASGARSAGTNVRSETNPFWVGARLPVFATTLYAPRVLADDGSRLFFESADALVPRDTNGRIDVYQWEEAGAGGCEEADATFSSEAGGCIDLISSGKSLTDSGFVDATPSGNDVFFTTLASLLPQDYGLIDIYDARVGGGFPPPPPPPPPCLGDACQNPTSPPDDPTPASASFRGQGDPPAQGSARRKPRCPKGKRRVGGKGAKSRCAPKRKGAQRKRVERKAKR